MAVLPLGIISPTVIPWYPEYREITLHWRPAYKSHYSVALNIMKYYVSEAFIEVRSYDPVPLNYAYIILHKPNEPLSDIGFITCNTINSKNSIVYNSKHIMITD